MTKRRQNSEFWRRQARRYDRAIDRLNRRFDQMAVDVAAEVDGVEVLEIAAGTGLVTRRLSSRAKRVVATDQSIEMLDILRARMEDISADNVQIQIADAVELPFANASFDAIVMANILHLLSVPTRALAEVRRVLRPDGVLCVPTFCHGESARAHVVSRVLGLVRFPVVTRFSGQTLAMLVEDAGYSVVKQTRYPGLLPITSIIAAKGAPE